MTKTFFYETCTLYNSKWFWKSIAELEKNKALGIIYLSFEEGKSH